MADTVMRARETGPGAAVPPLVPRYVLIGVHGGAGASTLVRLLDPMRKGEFVEWKTGMAAPFDRVPVLVARSTPYGLMVAASFITRWRPDLSRPVLVIVADVPFPASPLVRYRQRALSSQVRALIDVPYLYPLRHVDDPAQTLKQRRVAARVGEVRRRLIEAATPASGGS